MEEIELKFVPELELAKPKQEYSNFTETTCFLCQENINYHKHDNSFPQDIKVYKVSLLRVCRYLKVDCQKQLSGDNVSSLVILCGECKPVTENLTNLLEQLELLQMKVDHSLGQFTRLSKFSEEDKNIGESNLLVQIIKNCNKTLNAVLPKVSIESAKISASSPSPPKFPTRRSKTRKSSLRPASNEDKSKNWKCNFCPRSFVLRKSLQVHRRQQHNQQIDYFCSKCDTKFDKRSDFIQHNNFACSHLPSQVSKNNPPAGLRTCILCNPSQTVSKKNWARHNIRFHIETYFTPYKLQHVSFEIFKIYCEHVFNMQYKSSKTSRNSDNIIVRKCPYCSEKFTNQYLLRCHLINGHKNIVSKMVIATQKHLTISDVKNGKKLPSVALSECEDLDKYVTTVPQKKENALVKYYDCTLCHPKRTITMWEKMRHNAQFHVESIFSQVRNPDVSEHDFKIYCEHLVNQESKSFKKIPNDMDLHRRSKTECGHCKKSFCLKWSTVAHLVTVHKDILKEKLMELQNNKGVRDLQKWQETGSSVIRAANKKNVYEHLGRNCKHCGRILSTECGLRRHLRLVHKIEPKKVGTEIAAKGDGDENGIMMEKVEVIEENFEESDVFVTKVDISEFRPSLVNYAEMEGLDDHPESICEADFVAENDTEEFDVETVSENDPLEI